MKERKRIAEKDGGGYRKRASRWPSLTRKRQRANEAQPNGQWGWGKSGGFLPDFHIPTGNYCYKLTLKN